MNDIFRPTYVGIQKLGVFHDLSTGLENWYMKATTLIKAGMVPIKEYHSSLITMYGILGA